MNDLEPLPPVQAEGGVVVPMGGEPRRSTGDEPKARAKELRSPAGPAGRGQDRHRNDLEGVGEPPGPRGLFEGSGDGVEPPPSRPSGVPAPESERGRVGAGELEPSEAFAADLARPAAQELLPRRRGRMGRVPERPLHEVVDPRPPRSRFGGAEDSQLDLLARHARAEGRIVS